MRHSDRKPRNETLLSGWRGRIRSKGAFALILMLGAGVAAWFWEVSQGRAITDHTPQHFIVNHRGSFQEAVKLGFNLADVASVATLDELPEGTKGILWIGNGYNQTCSWQNDDETVARIARAAASHPRFSGIYFISDTPHPRVCPDGPQRIAERTELIKQIDPDGRTFIAVSGDYKNLEEFAQLAGSADLFGIVVYPCNTKKPTCEIQKIRDWVDRAFSAGIPVERLVPVLQAFGQACSTAEQKWYRMPSEDELHEIFAVWDELLPPQTRPFDMTYSWGEQERHACPSLETANGNGYPDLQTLFASYFAAME